MKKTLLVMMLVAGSAMAAPRFGFSVGIGAPAPVAVVQPPCPGPGYVWVDGYYEPDGDWVQGYWRAPAVNVVVGPRYYDRDDYRRNFDRDRHFDRNGHFDRDHDARRDFRR